VPVASESLYSISVPLHSFGGEDTEEKEGDEGDGVYQLEIGRFKDNVLCIITCSCMLARAAAYEQHVLAVK
jgi:hypothetical protein